MIECSCGCYAYNTGKKEKYSYSATELLEKVMSNIKELAQFIGQVVASFQAATFEPLWYRHMEDNTFGALQQWKGNYDAIVNFIEETKCDILW